MCAGASLRIRTFGTLLPPILGLVAFLSLSSCSDSNEPSDQPTILLMNPRVVTRGSGFGLWVYGENFGEGATINWNGVPRQTTAVSTTVLSTVILPADVPTEGTRPGHGVPSRRVGKPAADLHHWF